MTILRNLLETRSVENARLPLTAARLLDWFGNSSSTAAGINVNTEGAIGKTIVVYRAISLVAGAIAALPLVAFKAGLQRSPVASAFIRDPHWDMTSMELWETALFHLLGWGNFYAEKVRDGGDAVRYIDPISPAAVNVKRIERTRGNPLGKVFEVSYNTGTKREFTPETILHVPGPGYDGMTGLSPIGIARQGIALGLAAEEYGARLYASGTLQQGFLHTDHEINQATADDIKARWEARQGLKNAHGVAVLDRGLKFESLSINPVDAQFVESRKYQDSMTATLYGIPPHLLGQVEKSTSWGTGIEQQNIGLVTYTLRPWIVRLEQRVSRECLETPVVCQFDTGQLLRGDEKGRADAARVWIEAGVKSRQSVRLSENLPPVDGADHFVIPANWQVLGEDGHPAEPEVSLTQKVEMVGQLIRAGFDPVGSLAAMGLPEVAHTGLLPVTVGETPPKTDTTNAPKVLFINEDDHGHPDSVADTEPMVPLAVSANGSTAHQEVRDV